MKNDFDDQLTHVRQRIPDSVNIVLDTRHQFSGVCLVKKAAAETLDMVKQVFSHVGGDRRAYFVEGVLLSVLTDTPTDADDQDSAQQIGQD